MGSYNYHRHFELPILIEAEDFFFNNGFQISKCQDVNGGENTGYADDGDYLDYLINVPKAGKYLMEFRVASQYSEAEILVMHTMGDKILPTKAVKFTGTGGWQNWETQRTSLILPEGKIVFRIYSRSGQHNLNWFSFSDATGIVNPKNSSAIKVFPNPASDSLNIDFPVGEKTVKMINMEGKPVMEFTTMAQHKTINTSSLSSGIYILQVSGSGLKESHKIQIIR